MITMDEFEQLSKDQRFLYVLESIPSVTTAAELFEALDCTGDEKLTVEEFVRGVNLCKEAPTGLDVSRAVYATPGGRQHAGRSNFGRLVLGCIDADFCNQIPILYLCSSSTKDIRLVDFAKCCDINIICKHQRRYSRERAFQRFYEMGVPSRSCTRYLPGRLPGGSGAGEARALEARASRRARLRGGLRCS